MEPRNSTANTPPGMTLIELLVVISILGLLSVIVLPALSGNRENTANQNAAQQMSGLINQSRNDAISASRWAGITVPANGNGLDIARCRVPPPYRGDLFTSTVQYRSSPSPNIVPVFGGDLLNITQANIAGGDLISFRGQRQRYVISSSPTPAPSGLNILNPGITHPWPPTGVDMTFSIERKPRVVGTTLSLSTESSIDMRWSGTGGIGSFTEFWNGTGSGPPEVSVLFDERGAARQLIIDGTRNVVDGPVFFLIGRSDRRNGDPDTLDASDDTTGANWQYLTSYWIVIDPVSGQTRIAECFPNSSTVEASQLYVREGSVSQGF